VPARKRQQQFRPQRERFADLDLLRGVAALSVLLWHAPKAGIVPPLGRAYLAVDLFFVLSGFVIAHAYEQRLRGEGGFRQYCLARLIRLYPLYLAATLLSAAFILSVAIVGSGEHASAAQVARTVAPALLFLPTPTNWSVNPKFLYPLAFTAWSLLWELLVNVLYGAGGFRLRNSLLGVPIVTGAAGIVLAFSIYGGLDLGWGWEGAWCGAPRALFSFFAGVAIFRIRKRFRAPGIPALIVAAILIGVLVPQEFGGRAYDAACVFVLFPLLVWFGADALQSDRMRHAGALLGYLSYPIYLLQGPFGLAIEGAGEHLNRIAPQSTRLEPVAYLAVTIIGSWLIARLVDSPVREWLGSRFLKGVPQPRAQTAP
jgi:peptidoglycan/LPS O-acetylase OafA/YrhL